jgi:hypothetical protein
MMRRADAGIRTPDPFITSDVSSSLTKAFLRAISNRGRDRPNALPWRTCNGAPGKSEIAVTRLGVERPVSRRFVACRLGLVAVRGEERAESGHDRVWGLLGDPVASAGNHHVLHVVRDELHGSSRRRRFRRRPFPGPASSAAGFGAGRSACWWSAPRDRTQSCRQARRGRAASGCSTWWRSRGACSSRRGVELRAEEDLLSSPHERFVDGGRELVERAVPEPFVGLRREEERRRRAAQYQPHARGSPPPDSPTATRLGEHRARGHLRPRARGTARRAIARAPDYGTEILPTPGT